MELTFNKKREECKMDLIVEKAKQGNKDAFSTLIQNNKLVMFKVSKRILENDENIKDVIQETIIKAYNGIKITAKKEGLSPLTRGFCLTSNMQKNRIQCSNIKQILAENKDEFTMIFVNPNKNISKFENYRISYSKPYKSKIYKNKAVKIDLSK